MRTLGPFENAPRLAVAVSGGADSLALCLLAQDWAAEHGGSVVALTVDHGLRPDAAAEAAQVGLWLAGRGIRHVILRWTGTKPAAGIQQAARYARYRLLIDWCRSQGNLHLMLGHHGGDQAETVLHRVLRGSGISGLAGMAPLMPTRELQLMRPLLAEPPATLRRWLAARGQPWIEDPSNRDLRFERNRLRAFLPELGGAGVSEAMLGQSAARMADARAAMDSAVAALVGRSCQVHPAGYVAIDRTLLAAAAPEVGSNMLARVAMAVGGGLREPGREPARRALAALGSGTAPRTTFGRCRLAARGRILLVCREVRGLPDAIPLKAGDRLLWDGRFRITVCSEASAVTNIVIRPLAAGDGQVLQQADCRQWADVPAWVRLTLPVLEDEAGLLAAPAFGWQRPGIMQSKVVDALWSPRNGITGPGYFLVKGNSFIFAAN